MARRAGTLAVAAFLLWGSAPAAWGAPPPADKPELPRGRLVERVATTADPGETYTLYLPSGYTPDRQWPILYAFDSLKRGAGFAEVFRPGAERFGWIVVSAERAWNLQTMEDNLRIMRALWADTHARFAVDDRRVYAAGFSGLTRFVCTLGITAPGSLAGVIGASGGFPLGHPPSKETPFPFFGTVGNGDFNYYEMLDAEEAMRRAGLAHHVEVFAGEHEWPPQDLAARALAWMELQAMRRGSRAKDPQLLDRLWSEDLARAHALEAAGQLYPAFRAWSALAADFAGLRNTAEAERQVAALRSNEALRRDLAAREARDRRDRDLLLTAPRIFAGATPDLSPDNLGRVLSDLKIPELKKKAQSADDPEEKLAAERVLYALALQTGLYLPREHSARKDYDRAIFFLRIGGEIYPDNERIPYRLAVAYAHKGNRKQALAHLRRAVEMGWNELAELEAEEAFAPLRQSEEYRKLVEDLRQRPPS
jgi:predicted esterase